MSALGRSPLARFSRRARDAWRGVALLYGRSGNARIEVTLADLALSAALAEGDAWRIGLVALASAGVLAMEAMNSALEFAVDRVGTERHPLAGAAKDSAAGAVLLVAAGAAGMSLAELGPDVAACWHAFHHAAAWQAAAWLVLLAALLAGAVLPERDDAQGRGAGRRIG